MYCEGFLKSFELAGIGSAIKVGCDYRGLTCITPEFEGIGSAVEIRFDYRGLARTLWISESSEFVGMGFAVEAGFDDRGSACIKGCF